MRVRSSRPTAGQVQPREAPRVATSTHTALAAAQRHPTSSKHRIYLTAAERVLLLSVMDGDTRLAADAEVSGLPLDLVKDVTVTRGQLTGTWQAVFVSLYAVHNMVRAVWHVAFRNPMHWQRCSLSLAPPLCVSPVHVDCQRPPIFFVLVMRPDLYLVLRPLAPIPLSADRELRATDCLHRVGDLGCDCPADGHRSITMAFVVHRCGASLRHDCQHCGGHSNGKPFSPGDGQFYCCDPHYICQHLIYEEDPSCLGFPSSPSCELQ